jgi:flavin reductase (DIM6/NTAB) family NADH-FMN oxidoreductase RutF
VVDLRPDPTSAAAEPTPPADGVPGSAEALRHVMGQFASGVTIVTAVRDGVRHAMTATAVCSVSLNPPLILVCVSKASRFHAAITETEAWAVSLLAAGQEAIARHFANRGRDLGTQFDRVPHSLAPASRAPLIDGALAWLDCTTFATHDGGDHTIVVGQVVRASRTGELEDPGAPPLTYFRGAYSSGGTH